MSDSSTTSTLKDSVKKLNTKSTFPVSLYIDSMSDIDYESKSHGDTWFIVEDLNEIEKKNKKFSEFIDVLSNLISDSIYYPFKESFIPLYQSYFSLNLINKEISDLLEKYIRPYRKIMDFAFDFFGELKDFNEEESEIIDDYILKLIKEDTLAE